VNVRFPVFHREIMGDDARSRLEVEQLRAQFHVDPRQQVHGDDRRFAEIGFEEIALIKRNLVQHTGRFGVFVCLADTLGIEVDAEAARAMFLCGRNDDAPVAGTEVDQVILGSHFRNLQHALHHLLRRRHVRNARLLRIGMRHEQRRNQNCGGTGHAAQVFRQFHRISHVRTPKIGQVLASSERRPEPLACDSCVRFACTAETAQLRSRGIIPEPPCSTPSSSSPAARSWRLNCSPPAS
jgi:hypothetical protein